MSTSYKVDGMTCGGCVSSTTRALQSAAPGLEFEVSLEDGTIRVDGEHEAGAVARAIDDAGFTLADPGDADRKPGLR